MTIRFPKAHPIVAAVGLATLGSGLVNIYSVIGPSLPDRMRLLKQVFPLEVIGASRFLTLLVGFALVVSSLNVFKRKRRAFTSVAVLAAACVVFHLIKGIDYEEAAFSLLLLGLLATARRHFTVKSRTPNLKDGLIRLSIAFLIAFAYGVAGFWLLEPRHFGINFHIGQAVHHTLLFLSLAGDPQVTPYTRYAHWFINSLYLITATAFAYSVFALFRPVLYRYTHQAKERAAARQIVARHGLAALDYFKTWDDKSYWFSRSGQSFLAYRVAANFAVVLGDPVGPAAEAEQIVRDFAQFCGDNDWGVAFYQALPKFRDAYRRAGFKALKIGDEGVVDLETFSLEGKAMKATRTAVRKLEKTGIRARYVPAPLPDEVLDAAEEVSGDWLRIDGRRERTFTLGRFDRDYVRGTPVLLVEETDTGRVLAFGNLIRSGIPGEMTIDLMRRRADAPNGVMDFLFVKLFQYSQTESYSRFSLGMAPMAGFQEHEPASPEERAVHAFFQRLNFLFSFKGLRAYKAKFATHWEPRYAYYTNVLQLPRLAIALGRVSTLAGQDGGQDDTLAGGDDPLPAGAGSPARQKHRSPARPRRGRLLPAGGAAAAARACGAFRAGRWWLARIRRLDRADHGVVGL